jgi:polygalacturonase
MRAISTFAALAAGVASAHHPVAERLLAARVAADAPV